MKILPLLTAAVFVTTLNLGSLASAQGVVPGSESTLLLATTQKFLVPDVFARTGNGEFVLDEDGKKTLVPFTSYTTVKGETLTYVEEEGYKVVTRKYGVKELLTDLLEAGGYFPDGETKIAGWSLKCVQGNGTREVYLVKKGVTPVKVTNVVNVDFGEGPPVGKLITKVTGPPTGFYEKGTVTGSFKSQGYIDIGVSFSGVLLFNCSGNADLTSKAVLPPVTDVEVGNELPSLVILTTVKGTGLRGNGGAIEGSFSLDGTASLNSPVLVPDVSVYPNFGDE